MEKYYTAHSKFTTAPDSFLPFLITEDPDAIIGGNIQLSPILSPRETDELLEKINAEYPVPCLENGYLLNLAEIFSLSTSLYPVVFTDGHFESTDKKYLGLGTKAVVIYDPIEFIERLGRAVAIQFPNIRFLEVGKIQYSNDSEQWSLYNRSKNESWKNEFLVIAKLNPTLRLESGKYAEPVILSIGDLSHIAVAVSVEDLIAGNFPAELADKNLIQQMNSYTPRKKEIQNYSFSFMADLKVIVPDKKWLGKFSAVLGNDWIANTAVERLYADGDALPRVVYHSINRFDKIHIGINRMDFSFARYTNQERKIINDLIGIIDRELKPRCYRMSVITNANLGDAVEVIAKDNAFVKETKIKFHKGLQVTHDIETGYCMHRNILGINSSQRAWHYTIKTETPEYERVTWYELQDVLNFFEEVSAYNAEVINSLMRGDAYAGYREI